MANNNQDDTQVSQFREYNCGASIDVEITQYDRKWYERFRRYKFWYVLRITIDMFFMNEVLDIHQDALEGVFAIAIQTMLDRVQLQHFRGKNQVIQTNFVQAGLEHQDFTDYIYSSRLVKYGDFKFNKVVGNNELASKLGAIQQKDQLQ